MNGPSTSRSAASTTGMFTAFETRPPSSAATTCSATITPGPILRLVGRGGQVRRDDDVVELEQRARVGLLREDVERRARELARPKRLDRAPPRRRARRGLR